MTENHIKASVFTALDTLQLKKNDDCKTIDSVNPLYLLVNHESRYAEEKAWVDT